MGTPIFCAKRASNSKDTVDYIVQRAARKNSSGIPGLRRTAAAIKGNLLFDWVAEVCPHASRSTAFKIGAR